MNPLKWIIKGDINMRSHVANKTVPWVIVTEESSVGIGLKKILHTFYNIKI